MKSVNKQINRGNNSILFNASKEGYFWQEQGEMNERINKYYTENEQI